MYSVSNGEKTIAKLIQIIDQLLLFSLFIIAIEAIAGGPQLTNTTGIFILGMINMIIFFTLNAIVLSWGSQINNFNILLVMLGYQIAILLIIGLAGFGMYTYGMNPSYLSTALTVLFVVGLSHYQIQQEYKENGEIIIKI